MSRGYLQFVCHKGIVGNIGRAQNHEISPSSSSLPETKLWFCPFSIFFFIQKWVFSSQTSVWVFVTQTLRIKQKKRKKKKRKRKETGVEMQRDRDEGPEGHGLKRQENWTGGQRNCRRCNILKEQTQVLGAGFSCLGGISLT